MDKSFIYGRIYSEITNGFSKIDVKGNLFYFKHPSFAEHFGIYSNYDIILAEAKKRGLDTEKEQLENAILEGWWSSEKEYEINILKKTVHNLNKTKNKLVLPSQKDAIDSQIKRNRAILATFSKERKDIIRYTAEDYANQRFLDETVIISTYKNRELTERAFSGDTYYDLSDEDVEKIREGHNNNLFVFSFNNLKLIAASGFFQNLIYLNDDAPGFWGKPCSLCTKYQIDLLIYGKMYKNLIKNYSENGKPVSDEILEDPEKFIDWVDNQSNTGSKSNIKKSAKSSSGQNAVSSYVGATQEDLNKLGVKTEKLRGKSLLELAAEKGGTLEKNDYLSARENN